MAEPAERQPKSAIMAYLDGLQASVRSVFFYVLLGNYLGIGALSHEYGFSPLWMVLSTMLIWAAPAQLILISRLGTASLIEVAIAVTLSSVRFLPMVAALLPTLRGERTRQRDLLLPMHFTAISVWIEGLRLTAGRPRGERVSFYNGLGTGLMFAAVIASAAGFYLAASLPPILNAALLFFTPMAVLMVSARNSRTLLDGLAFGLGLAVWPVVASLKLGLELMWTGLVAGTVAYIVHRIREAMT